MKLTPIQNAFTFAAAVCLLVGKYVELSASMALGMLLILVLINYEYYIAFWKRVCAFLYLRWQFRQRYKLEKLRMSQGQYRQP